ncbi:MAG: hypothetical protein VYD64_04900, partial [Pseudomonadota bacterium]|nr:hypothetical protein [Pseudomonadota bacterium]
DAGDADDGDKTPERGRGNSCTDSGKLHDDLLLFEPVSLERLPVRMHACLDLDPVREISFGQHACCAVPLRGALFTLV